MIFRNKSYAKRVRIQIWIGPFRGTSHAKCPPRPPRSKFGSGSSSVFRRKLYAKPKFWIEPRSAIIILYKDRGKIQRPRWASPPPLSLCAYSRILRRRLGDPRAPGSAWGIHAPPRTPALTLPRTLRALAHARAHAGGAWGIRLRMPAHARPRLRFREHYARSRTHALM